MLKRLLLSLIAAAGLFSITGCTSCGVCNPIMLHCESPCYCKAWQRNSRQIMDTIDVHVLNYDRHNPFQCDPCIGP